MANVLNIFLTILSLLAFAGCKKDDDPDKVYRINGTMTVDGRARTYLLNLPPQYYEKDSMALVVGLHGTGGSAVQFDRDYGFTAKANSEGFVIVYPEGVRSDGILKLRTWNAGICCDYAAEQNINDAKYIRTLIDELVAKYKINPKRVYLTGMSNGGMMAYRLASEMPDKFAAVAPVSSTMMIHQPINNTRAMPILHIHSAKDTKVPYNGGVGLGGYNFAPVDSTLRVWSQSNACVQGPKVVVDDSRYKLTEWTDCKNNAVMKAYLTQDGGHSWPGGNKSNARGDEPSTVINATDLIWDFFKTRSLP